MKKKLALFLAITSLLCCSCESGSQTDGTTTTTPKISTTTTTSEAPTLTTTTTTDNEATVTTTTTTAQTSVTSEDPTTSEEENTTTPPDSTTTEPSDTTASSANTTTPEAEITTTTATTTVPQTTVTPSTTTTATTSYTEMTKTTMYATTSVNVRSGAGTSYDILGRLSANQSVTVIGTSGNWYAIQFNGKTGFVSKSYLTKSKVTTTTTSKPNTDGFSSVHAYGTDGYTWDLLEYYGITERRTSTAYTEGKVEIPIESGYEKEIEKFIANANGRQVIYYAGSNDTSFYGEVWLGYVPIVEEYVWTEADCYRLFDELRAYADSVGYDKLYLPTEVTPFDGTIDSYRGWVDYDCTGLIATGGGFLNDSNTFAENYNYFLEQYKVSIDHRADVNNTRYYGMSYSITLTTLKDFNKLCKLWDWPYEPGYDNYDADEETSYVFIINDQANAGWWLNE